MPQIPSSQAELDVPAETDEEVLQRNHQARLSRERDEWLRRRLRDAFAVPEQFMDVAMRIWWDGKED